MGRMRAEDLVDGDVTSEDGHTVGVPAKGEGTAGETGYILLNGFVDRSMIPDEMLDAADSLRGFLGLELHAL